MRRTRRATILSVGAAALLWTSLALGEQGDGNTWRQVGSGTGRGWVQFRAYVLYAGSMVSTTHGASSSHFYQLNHRLGQVIIEMPAEAPLLSPHRFWVRGKERLFETLAAEENLFKEVEISGLVREYQPSTGILELFSVQVVP